MLWGARGLGLVKSDGRNYTKWTHARWAFRCRKNSSRCADRRFQVRRKASTTTAVNWILNLTLKPPRHSRWKFVGRTTDRSVPSFGMTRWRVNWSSTCRGRARRSPTTSSRARPSNAHRFGLRTAKACACASSLTATSLRSSPMIGRRSRDRFTRGAVRAASVLSAHSRCHSRPTCYAERIRILSAAQGLLALVRTSERMATERSTLHVEAWLDVSGRDALGRERQVVDGVLPRVVPDGERAHNGRADGPNVGTMRGQAPPAGPEP